MKTDALEMHRSGPAIDFAGKTRPYLPAAPVLKPAIVDPREGDEWDRAVASHPAATIFHTSAWARVLCDTYGHAPKYLRLTEGGTLAALLPVMEVKSPLSGGRGVSLPFSDFCGPLCFGDERAGALAVERLAAMAQEEDWKYCELRAPLPGSAAPASAPTFYAHTLDLTKSPNELFDGLASSVRRAIRKAERAEVAVEIASDLGAVREFYQLHTQTRRRHGTPPQPFAFFREIHDHILHRGLGYIVLARRHARPIAAAVFFHFGWRAIYKFGASDARFQTHRANNLVMWEGIKEAAQRGLTTLHLGRTDVEQAGLRRFKRELGAVEEMLPYFRFDPREGRWTAQTPSQPAALAGAVFRRLPLTINRLAGNVIYPHLH